MGNGGPRPGAGAPKGNRNRAKKPELPIYDAILPRPIFTTAHDFAIWALNAPDVEVPMELKLRAMQVLAPIEAKQPKVTDVKPVTVAGKFAPRSVKGFDVFAGGRQ